MNDIRTVHLEILQRRLAGTAWELAQFHFHPPGPRPPWQPLVNLYRCPDRFVICMELAGIDRAEISLQAEPFRIHLNGWRRPPLPSAAQGQPLQVLALEIDDGRCEREIPLPEEIVPAAVQAEQRNGLLWIDLPLRWPK